MSNSLENNPSWLKNNRLDWDMWSIKEADSWLASNWENLWWRIMIWIDDKWNLIIEDWRHLLEAYRRLEKDIPIDKIWFRNADVEKLFNEVF